MKKIFNKKLFSLLFLIIACIYIFYNTDTTHIVDSVKEYSLTGVIFLYVATIFTYCIIAIRWRILSHNTYSTKSAFEAAIICTGINSITPARMGDISRIYYLNKVYKYPVYELVPIAFLERLLDIMSLFSVALLLLFYVEDIKMLILPIGIAITLFVMIFVVTKIYFRVIIAKLEKMKYEKLSKFFMSMIITLNRYTLKTFAQALFVSYILWFYYILMMLIFINTSTDIVITWIQTITVFVVSALGISLPATPAGIGIYEASVVLSMGWFGIDKERALTFAITYHFVQITSSVIYTFLILYFKKIDYRQYLKGKQS